MKRSNIVNIRDYTSTPVKVPEGTVKNKDYYASLFMELVKEGYEEFLFRKLEPKNLSAKLKEILPHIKQISSVQEWFESKDVDYFYNAVLNAGERDCSLAAYVKPLNFDEITGYYCYAYYNDLEQAICKLEARLEKMKSDPRYVDFLYTEEIVDILRQFYEKENKAENELSIGG